MEFTEKFVKPSEIHEQLFVGFLWNTPSLYRKYRKHKIDKDTFTNPKNYFYYALGWQMYENSIRKFDDVTVYSFVSTKMGEDGKNKTLKYYEKYGGYSTIQLLIDECQREKDNDEFHFSEIQKYEALRNFQKEGLVNTSNIELVNKLASFNLKQLQMYFNHKHKKAFSNVNSGEVTEHDLLDDLDETIRIMNAGQSMGLEFHGTPRLNKTIKGWKEGTLMYLVLSSGMGKTSFGMYAGIMALLEHNEKGIIFANEEGIFKWRMLLLATVASTILKKAIKRDKLAEGNYDAETMAILQEAKEWLKRNRKDMIKFVELTKYRVEDVINRIELYRPLGYKYVFFDTFKPDLSGSDDTARWQAFSNSAQELYDTIKPDANNCATLATVQLKIGKEYRTLDLSSIGKSLEIVEVAGVVLMGRLVFSDEVGNGKNRIEAYNWEKNEKTGKWKKVDYDLDPKKQYMLLFIAKNREGSADIGIVFEVNYAFNTWIERAYFDPIRVAKV